MTDLISKLADALIELNNASPRLPRKDQIEDVLRKGLGVHVDEQEGGVFTFNHDVIFTFSHDSTRDDTCIASGGAHNWFPATALYHGVSSLTAGRLCSGCGVWEP